MDLFTPVNKDDIRSKMARPPFSDKEGQKVISNVRLLNYAEISLVKTFSPIFLVVVSCGIVNVKGDILKKSSDPFQGQKQSFIRKTNYCTQALADSQ